MKKSSVIRNYFVDEAGDAALFTTKGRVIVGTEGCSRYFILGLLDVAHPDALSKDLDDTRQNAYGRYTTQKKPLTLAALENDSPGI